MIAREKSTGYLPAIYGFAHSGKTLFWAASDLYFAFYMNEVCEISPAVTGFVVGGSLFVAALADFTVGQLVTYRIQSLASASFLQRAGSVVSAAALLLFALSSFASPAWRVAACTATLMTFRMAYAILDVPQNALLSLAAVTAPMRAAMVVARNVMGGLARLALAAAFIPVMAAPATGAAPRFLGLVAVLSVVAIGSAALLTRYLVRHTPAAAAPASGHHVATPRLARHCFRALVTSAMITGVVQLEPYLATRVIIDAGQGQVFMTTIAIGVILSQALWHRLPLEAPPRLWPAAIGAVIVAAIAFAVLPPVSLAAVVLLGLAYGTASGGLMFSLWASFSHDVLGEPAFDRYARFTASAKIGQGSAIVGAGILLEHLRRAGLGPSPLWATGALTLGALVLALTLRPRNDRVDMHEGGNIVTLH